MAWPSVLRQTSGTGRTQVYFDIESEESYDFDWRGFVNNFWGERWGLNPRPAGPQPAALTN